MSSSNVTEAAILALIFNATAWANYADNAASSPQTNIAAALHTADPGETGDMSTNECEYGSYARVNVARTSGGFTVSGSSVSPVAAIDFPICTSGSEVPTHFSFGKTGGGAAPILFYGTITPTPTISVGVMPRLTTATTVTMD